MSKFKVGDKVRCLETYGYQFTKDKIYTIREDSDIRVMITKDDMGSDSNGWNPKFFELVKAGMLEFENRFNKYWMKADLTVTEYRLKPKNEFEPFYVNGDSWLVKLKGNALHIGCEVYCSKTFHKMLIELLENSKGLYQYAPIRQMVATKSGILDGNHTLSWSDAQLILNKLNELEK